jgi:hypothetical protein
MIFFIFLIILIGFFKNEVKISNFKRRNIRQTWLINSTHCVKIFESHLISIKYNLNLSWLYKIKSK